MNKKLLGLVFVIAIVAVGLSTSLKDIFFNSPIRLASVENGLLPDFRITALRYLNPDNLAQEIQNPIRGDRVVPVVTIENTGEEASNRFYVNVEDLTTAVGGNPDGSITFATSGILVENLAPGERRNIQTIGDFILRSQGGNHEWRVTSDPYDTVTEHSEIDNIFSFSTPITDVDWRNPTKDYFADKPRMTPQNIVRNNANEINRNAQFTLETSVRNLDYVNGIDPVNDTVTVALQIDGREVARPIVNLVNGRGTFNYIVRGADLAIGEHAVNVVTDPANAIAESNERNNTVRGNAIRVMEAGAAGQIAIPDLTISNVTYELYNNRGTLVAAADLQRGDLFYVNVSVRNIGTAPINDIFYVDIEDSTRIAGVNNDGSIRYATQGVMFRGVGVNETVTATTISPFVLRGNTGAGERFNLRMKVDPYERTSELNEGNNLYNAEIPIQRIQFTPVTHDYLPYSLRWVPHNVVQMDGTWEINQADTIRFSLRLDDADYVGRGENITVENVPVRIQAGNVTRNVNVTFNDSSMETEVSFTGRELGIGTHPVTISIDSDNRFEESNERNNTREFNNIRVMAEGAYQYEPLPMPELSLESVQLKRLDQNGWTDVAPEQLQRGDRFLPYVTVRNTGTQDPGLFYVIVEDQSRWMRDPNTNQMVHAESGIMIRSIAPGEAATGTTVSPYLIDNTGNGPFLLKFRVDGYERVSEMNENNNFSTFSIPRENVPFDRPVFDFLVDFVGRKPVNVVYQDNAWHMNTSETLDLEITVRNNDYVNADYMDHSVRNLPIDLVIGNNFRRRLLVDLADGVNNAKVPVTISGNQLNVGRNEVSLIVDPENGFVETNERNNYAPNLFNDVVVTVPPVAPNLKATYARFIQVDGDRYYPAITILNDSDIPVEHTFTTFAHNKSDLRGLDEYGQPRYGKLSKQIQRMNAHESIELIFDTLVINANEANKRFNLWAQVDDSGYANFDDIDESNETDNNSLFNIGALVTAIPNAVPFPAPAADPAPAPSTELPSTELPNEVAPAPAPAPSPPAPAPKPAPALAAATGPTLTTKLSAGVKSIKGTCTSTFLNSPKFTAYVNGKVASPTVNCISGKFELVLKIALKAKDSFQIETTKGATKSKSGAVIIK